MARIKPRPCEGNSIKGSVLDCNYMYLSRALKDYDKQLYLKWNPYKAKGRGLWELRRTPNEKSMVYKTFYRDNGKRVNVYQAEFKESDWVNLILEVPTLDYRMVEAIKDMDTWGKKNWLDEQDYKAKKLDEKQQDAAKAERKYAIRQDKQAATAFREMVMSGYNPLFFSRGQFNK